MKSHEYHFRAADLARFLGGLAVPALVFGGLMRLGALSGLWPTPWPALDVDHTILTHQVVASQTPNPAEILFLGDSSCLMDVSCDKFNQLLRGEHDSLNLGSFMYVGFDGYAAMLARYEAVNAGHLRTVVVLVHPEMLRGAQSNPIYLRFFSDFYARSDPMEMPGFLEQVRGVFGLHIFQDRFLSRMPLALPKEYGRYYGFNWDLYRFMDEHSGSAVDPHRYVPGPGQGNAEYRLAPALQSGCVALKAAIPAGAQLALGLTPIPSSFAPAGYSARWQHLLEEWGQWLQPNQLLTNLPPVLPDSNFASTTHLNRQGALQYTEIVARSLSLSPAR